MEQFATVAAWHYIYSNIQETFKDIFLTTFYLIIIILYISHNSHNIICILYLHLYGAGGRHSCNRRPISPFVVFVICILFICIICVSAAESQSPVEAAVWCTDAWSGSCQASVSRVPTADWAEIARGTGKNQQSCCEFIRAVLVELFIAQVLCWVSY